MSAREGWAHAFALGLVQDLSGRLRAVRTPRTVASIPMAHAAAVIAAVKTPETSPDQPSSPPPTRKQSPLLIHLADAYLQFEPSALP